MPIDRAKLIKVMAMTQSANDGEALNAIRMANEMLKVNKLDWDKAIAGTSSQSNAPRSNQPSTYRPPQPTHRPVPRPPMRPTGRGTKDTHPGYTGTQTKFTDSSIPKMIKSLLRDSKGNFKDFLESIDNYWTENDYLTKGQYEALVNAYERAK